jgi:preprotein translocase subunit SecG
MYYFLLVLLVFDALLLGLVVLLQAGQGGGLASLGGGVTDQVLGGRQATTLLHRMSWICGGALMGISLLLSVVATNRQAEMTEVQRQLRTTPQEIPVAPLNPGAPQPLPAQPPPPPTP